MLALRRIGALLAAPLILAALISPAMAGGDEYVRDEFNTVSYSGTDGSMSWSGPWRETPLTDGPEKGEIRVVADDGCVTSNCLAFGSGEMTGRGIYRQVDLSAATGAKLTFVLQTGEQIGFGGRLDVLVSTDGWSWDPVTGIEVDGLDPGASELEYDISPWVGSSIRIGFFGSGYLEDAILIDDVTVKALAAVSGRAMDFSTAPSLDPIEDRTVTEHQQLRVPVTATDPDLPNDVLRFSLVEGPAGAVISPGGTVTWTPREVDGPGTHTITVRVEDAQGASAQMSFAVIVTEANSAPEIGLIPDQAVAPGDAMNVEVPVVDSDLPADTLTFTATGLPGGVSINRSTGVISGRIAATAAAGSGVATVTVTDDGDPTASDSRSFSWQVTLGNRSPVLELSEPNIGSDGRVSFTASATDPDGDDQLGFWLTQGIDQVPTGAVIDAATGVFTWSPTEDQLGAVFRFNVGVSDSGSPRLSDTQLVTIVLPEFNHAPEVDPVADMTSAEGESIRFPINVADPDGDNIEFSATGLPPGIDIDPMSGFIAGEIDFSAGTGSPYRVTVTVTDDGAPAAASEVVFGWLVTETNQPPLIEPISVIVLLDTPRQVVLEATDPDGDELSYDVVIPPGFGTLTGTPPNLTYTAEVGDRDEFTVSVGDGELSVQAVVGIEIRASNEAPIASVDEYNVPVDGRLDEAAPGVLGNDNDPDGSPLVALLLAAPDHGELTLNGDGSFSYVPETGYAGPDKFTYAAVDDLGEQTPATAVFNVVSPDQVETVTAVTASGFRSAVIAATTVLWQPPDATDGVLPRLSRALLSVISSGVGSVPKLGAPLLLLMATLALALTVGKVSLLPAGAGKTQGEGVVAEYDKARGFGRVTAEEGGEPVYIHAAAIEEGISLATGRRVEFIAADIKGRRIALNVWPS